jgi:hypothetical protein
VQGYQDWQTIQELNADRNCKASDGISFLKFAVLNQQMTRMNEDSRSWDDAMRARGGQWHYAGRINTAFVLDSLLPYCLTARPWT